MVCKAAGARMAQGRAVRGGEGQRCCFYSQLQVGEERRGEARRGKVVAQVVPDTPQLDAQDSSTMPPSASGWRARKPRVPDS